VLDRHLGEVGELAGGSCSKICVATSALVFTSNGSIASSSANP